MPVTVLRLVLQDEPDNILLKDSGCQQRFLERYASLTEQGSSEPLLRLFAADVTVFAVPLQDRSSCVPFANESHGLATEQDSPLSRTSAATCAGCSCPNRFTT